MLAANITGRSGRSAGRRAGSDRGRLMMMMVMMMMMMMMMMMANRRIAALSSGDAALPGFPSSGRPRRPPGHGPLAFWPRHLLRSRPGRKRHDEVRGGRQICHVRIEK